MKRKYIGFLNVIFFILTIILLIANFLFSNMRINDTLAAAVDGLAANLDEQNNIQVFNNNKESVVYVSKTQLRRDFFSLNLFEVPAGTSTGFIWDRDGTIITNYHVVQGANEIKIRLNDLEVYEATIVGLAPESDVAVLKIDIPRFKSKPVKLGNSADLKVGNKVLAIGNPFGLDQTLTTGIVSALGRQIKSPSGHIVEGVIQTDAAINPGNSGGPLINSSSEVIGMNTAIVSSSGSSAGVGFAIPVDTLKKIVPQLITYGKVIHPILGIRIVDDSIARRYGIKGVIVAQVIKGLGADKAGLIGIKEKIDGSFYLGDVITKINDQQVRNSEELYQVLNRYAVGDKVKVTSERGGRTLNFSIQLSASN